MQGRDRSAQVYLFGKVFDDVALDHIEIGQCLRYGYAGIEAGDTLVIEFGHDCQIAVADGERDIEVRVVEQFRAGGQDPDYIEGRAVCKNFAAEDGGVGVEAAPP